MSGQIWFWIGGVAASLTLAAGAGALLGTGGAATALLAGLFPAGLAVAAILAAAGRQRALSDGLGRTLAAIGAGRTPEEGDVPPALAKAVAELAEAMHTTQGFLTGITGGLPIPFLLVDTDERVLFTNEATMRMVEIDQPPSSQLGRTLAEVFYNDSSRQTVVGRAIREGLVFSNKEVTITGHKGGRCDVLYNVFPLRDPAGRIIGGLCLYLDVTELRSKEAAICRQNDRATQQAGRAGALAADLATAARTLAGQVAQASQAAQRQRQRLDQVGDSVGRLGQSARHIAETARETDVTARQTRDEAAGAAETMRRVLSGMTTLSEKATALGSHMEILSGQAREVGGILGVISDIADQTNLLALNAAIEAARAGESGRGFAVVADEVRKLAEKTMAATAEVERNVTAIRTSADTNQRATTEAVSLVGDTTGVANAAGAALEKILTLANQTSAHVQAIAEAAAGQTEAGEKAGRAGSEIAGAAADTTQAMTDSARAVDDLSRVALALNALFDEIATPG